MATLDPERLAQLPDEMAFTILRAASNASPRLGILTIPGRKALETPNYISIASRGVAPHLSPDNFRSKTNIPGAYLALEDFIERPSDQVPIYQHRPPDGSSPLRSFCALPNDSLLVLGARRTPAVANLRPNTNQSTTIWTAFGAREMEVQEYANAVVKLDPDIAIALGDVLYGDVKASKARVAKMGDRSEAWLRLLKKTIAAEGRKGPTVFAPVLPIAKELQSRYLDVVEAEAVAGTVQGLALYSVDSATHVPSTLVKLPRFAITEPANPSEILTGIASSVDIFTVPFVGALTDAGIALTFMFNNLHSKTDGTARRPLGIDMRDDAHVTDVSSIVEGCTCYTCTTHHRAYIHHLLSAKEMLAWVLLQIHNHHVMDEFFAAVRKSIANSTFAQDVTAFEKVYEQDLPIASGQGPRARGYQFKSEGLGEAKKNEKAFTASDRVDGPLAGALDNVTFEDVDQNGAKEIDSELDVSREMLAESPKPRGDADAADLEKAGLARAL